MPAPGFVERLAKQALGVATKLSFLAPLLTRVTVGYAFLLTGRGKLAHLDNFTRFLTDLGVPFAAQQAPFVAGLELVGGICLILGLLTRVMSAALRPPLPTRPRATGSAGCRASAGAPCAIRAGGRTGSCGSCGAGRGASATSWCTSA